MRRPLLAFVAGTLVAFAQRANAAPDADLTAALAAAAGADVVVFDLPAAPGAPRVRAATVTRASVAAITAVLLDPARYGALLPSLVRHDETSRIGEARVVAWELEVPLFNLSGTLEVRPRPGGVEQALVEGDLSPGRVVFQAAARPDGGTTLTVDASLDVRRSSWFLRRVMARSPWGEPAALGAAVYAALRATALRAEHARDAAAFRPVAPFAPPVPGMPDGRVALAPALSRLASRGAAALVVSAPSGRLAGVSVAVPARESRESLAARLANPRSWTAFPGWRHVRPMPAARGGPATIVVEDSIPFVDLDATWQPVAGRARAWSAISGAARGAWFGWELGGTPAPAAVAVLTYHPRLERTGSIPRRFIEAEPLLEHGLALALTFVDALGATQPPARSDSPPPRGSTRSGAK